MQKPSSNSMFRQALPRWLKISNKLSFVLFLALLAATEFYLHRIELESSTVPLLNIELKSLYYAGFNCIVGVFFFLLWRSNTLLKKAVSLAQERQARLSIATLAGGVGIWEWDVISGNLIWDDQMYLLYGIDPDQFSGAYDAWKNVLSPKIQLRVQEEIRAVLEGKHAFDSEFEIFWPNGELRYIRGQATVVRNANGAAIKMIGTNWDITDQKTAEAKIEELAFYDQLTNLPNRRLFSDRLNRALIISERNKQYGALLCINIDQFKSINDSLGLGGGDKILQDMARQLSQYVRSGDTVARMGGDEFTVLLEQLGKGAAEAAAAAETVAEKILKAFAQSPAFDNTHWSGTLSIGITLFLGTTLDSAEVIQRADQALVQAKRAGRNQYQFFDQAIQNVMQARVTTERMLRDALKNDWLELFMQSQTDEHQEIHSAEVLLRLNHPQQGLMTPATFIEIAESTGIILPIGQWVLQAVCQQLALWASDPILKTITLSVNISIRQFQQENFVTELLSTLEQTGANPNLLVLELTENLFLGDLTDAQNKMKILKGYGVRFSLDDFGTGYSSLAYLKSLDFDQIKIDQSFVADVPVNASSCGIVRAIISMGQALNLKIIAEGVETTEQLDYLIDAGCQNFQGYWFSYPSPVNVFTDMVKKINVRPHY